VARPIVATMLGLTLDVAVADGQGPEPPLVVRKVRVESVGDGRRVMITLNRAPDGVRGSRLDNPLRLEIDIDGPPAEAGQERFPVMDEGSGVRARAREGGLSIVLRPQTENVCC